MAAARACLPPRVPLVVILGATGTGKTKLSLELAKRYQTEIISADSMQIYKGLDIITAKATLEERSIAPHHLLDFLLPHQTCTVVDFRNRAVKIIDDLVSKNKIPIVVGGTNYYIESILWKVLIADIEHSDQLVSDYEPGGALKKLKTDRGEVSDRSVSADIAETSTRDRAEVGAKRKFSSANSDEEAADAENSADAPDGFSHGEMVGFSGEYLHGRLKEVDPEMAERLHPNDKRKIMRSLQIWGRMGRKHSDILADQKAEEGGSSLGGPLRYPSCIIFWLYCEQDIHDKRLCDRVDTMIEEGLVEELLNFHQLYNKERIVKSEADYTKGVFQSIGFKEFNDYLMLDEKERDTEKGKKLFEESLNNLKIATKRYARKQNKHFKNRFLGCPNRIVPPIYKLDTSDVSQWQVNVNDKAISIIDSFIENRDCSFETEKKYVGVSHQEGVNPKTTHFCEICKRVFIGDFQYNLHMKSNKHQRIVKKLKKKQNKTNSTGSNSF